MPAVRKMERLAFMTRDGLLSALNLFVTEKVRQVKSPVKHLHLTSQISCWISPPRIRTLALHRHPNRSEKCTRLNFTVSRVCLQTRIIPRFSCSLYKMNVPHVSLLFRFSAIIRTSGSPWLVCLSSALWWITCLVLLSAQHVWWCHLQELTGVNWIETKGTVLIGTRKDMSHYL